MIKEGMWQKVVQKRRGKEAVEDEGEILVVKSDVVLGEKVDGVEKRVEKKVLNKIELKRSR